MHDIHSLSYFLIIQIVAGIVHTTGWPGVVTLIGRWFGKAKRGLLFGIWSSHGSIGTILGTLIAAHYVEHEWQVKVINLYSPADCVPLHMNLYQRSLTYRSLAFIVPGLIMIVTGVVIFLFVVDTPQSVGVHVNHEDRKKQHRLNKTINDSDSDPEELKDFSQKTMLPKSKPKVIESAVGFGRALRIPGVIEFSISLFFAKLVSYTFMFWLPVYIESSSKS